MGCGASLNQVHVLDERDGVVSKSGKRSHKKSKKADQFSVSSQDLGQGGSSLPSKVGRACRAFSVNVQHTYWFRCKKLKK